MRLKRCAGLLRLKSVAKNYSSSTHLSDLTSICVDCFSQLAYSCYCSDHLDRALSYIRNVSDVYTLANLELIN